ncbi:equilibrative nucleoside transporter 3-like [Mizuhopecten yessoensis]|uniref:Equilibrative nucleoside transporter 3 n=1 Tax=Mizuhopecten yessoensis TaxID=6573 RepID=A0A210Q392_MIZYE|nr:equilibrative nucleoside transporter 3-like [Mizuhopecten yessoensis]XP_021368418.1 equilibrative nucleoside transporter 3-like [Mizuhopecten yessoensis]XP_021368419.1 equilibrative nucleoside transporter 3-like [Mizuhopecten yessoensis]OWF43182.1 Equilibrative nucleoside transporter 3 [Mizuhopecten yessoensis]
MTRNSYNVSDTKHTNGTSIMNSQVDEKEKFLAPVLVEPGLDSINKNPDDLELNDEDNAPKDRYRIVFFIMLIHGIGILMPWNMLINAKTYFEDYKLSTNTSEVQELRNNFMFYLGIASQVPNFIMSGINTFCQCGGMPSSRRIVIAIAIEVVLFIATVILAMVDSTDWSREFFYITMLIAVFLNMATGVYQNSAFGIAATLPMKYTNAIVLGNNLSGVFIAVLNLLCSAGAPDPKVQAIYYFVVAIVILLVALDAYFLLPIMNFYKYYESKVTIALSNSESPSSTSFSQTMKQFKDVFMKIKVQAICVWFVFFVTLSIFPGVWSNIRRIDFPLSDQMFVGIFCFLSFNLFAVLGNLTSEFIKVPGPKFVWVPILLRGLLIPYFLFCNFQPGTGRTLAVLIESDYAAIFGGVILAFTGGYYSSLVMMYGPKLVEPEVAGKAGMIMAFCLVTGITTGVAFSFLLSVMVSW